MKYPKPVPHTKLPEDISKDIPVIPSMEGGLVDKGVNPVKEEFTLETITLENFYLKILFNYRQIAQFMQDFMI